MPEDIISYLKSLGFKPVIQTDKFGKFKDYEYLNRNRTYAELHDDNMFYLWLDITCPLLTIDISNYTYFELKEMIDKIIFNELNP